MIVPEWFAPKRFGLGCGFPIAWQGWAITIAYTALVVGTVTLLEDRWLPMLSIVVPATILFVLVCARTTRGGWHWRWGGGE
jgi:hypothetical protein